MKSSRSACSSTAWTTSPASRPAVCGRRNPPSRDRSPRISPASPISADARRLCSISTPCSPRRTFVGSTIGNRNEDIMRTHNLKIRTRLLLTVVVVGGLLAAGTGIALWTIRAFDTQARQLVRKDAHMAGATAQFALYVAELVRSERTFFLDDAPRSKEALAQLDAWNTAHGNAVTRLQEIEGLAETASEHASVAALRSTLAEYAKEFDAARTKLQAGGFMAADPTGPEARAMRSAIDKLQLQSGQMFERYREQMTAGG